MSFIKYAHCLQQATGNLEFVENFTRLTGIALLPVAATTPIERLVDLATKRETTVSDAQLEAFRQFALYVKDVVWDRLDPRTRDEDAWVIPGKFQHPTQG